MVYFMEESWPITVESLPLCLDEWLSGKHTSKFSWHHCWTLQDNIEMKKLLQEASKISSKLKNGGGIREAFEQYKNTREIKSGSLKFQKFTYY